MGEFKEMIAQYRVRIQTDQLITAASKKEAGLAILRNLAVALKFNKECPADIIIEVEKCLLTISELAGK